jgi:CubicO group peptidase (beta-lactamase class C family)
MQGQRHGSAGWTGADSPLSLERGQAMSRTSAYLIRSEGMRRLLLPLVLSCVARVGSAQGIAVQGRWIDTIFDTFNKKGSPGCAVGVIQRDVLTIARGYGEAEIRRHVPITPQTAFYVASLSKQFTAMSIVLLAQDGKLSLEDDIRKWVPEVPKLGTITIRQLLEHTSGLRDYYTLLGIAGWRPNELFTEQTLLDLIGRQKALNFTPGSEFLYNNTGYALLGIVVKRASGESLRDFAATRIFQPLGMTHTQFRDDHSTTIDGEAIGYLKEAGGYPVSIPQLDVVGDGGVFTTVDDLARWDANLDSGIVGGRSGVTLLQTPGRLNDGTVTGYALGLNVGSLNGLRTISHSGSYGGYQSTYLRFPDEHLSVITLCNVAVASNRLAEEVASTFIPQYFSLGAGLPPGPPVTLDRSSLTTWGNAEAVVDSTTERAPLGGKYYSDELDMEVTLRASNVALIMYRPVGDSLRFARLSRNEFSTGDQILMRLERDSTGAVSGFLLSAGRVRDLRFVKRVSAGDGKR